MANYAIAELTNPKGRQYRARFGPLGDDQNHRSHNSPSQQRVRRLDDGIPLTLTAPDPSPAQSPLTPLARPSPPWKLRRRCLSPTAAPMPQMLISLSWLLCLLYVRWYWECKHNYECLFGQVRESRRTSILEHFEQQELIATSVLRSRSSPDPPAD